jgi:hypothetical protein
MNLIFQEYRPGRMSKNTCQTVFFAFKLWFDQVANVQNVQNDSALNQHPGLTSSHERFGVWEPLMKSVVHQ